MRRLIVNADDFGLTSGVNRAIVESSHSGIVTSATLMAKAAASEDAIALARTTPKLRTGCHVLFIDGEPVADSVSSLLNRDGRFFASLEEFAQAVARGKFRPHEIEREAEAQIARILAAGLSLTHLDSHKHTHIFPQVLGPMLRAARACGIKAVRNPFEPLRAWPVRKLLAAPSLWLRSAGVAAFKIFSPAFSRAIARAGMRSPDGTVGIAWTGRLDQKALHALLVALPEGTWELVCHPGYSDEALRVTGTRLLRSREIELEALGAEETKQVLRRQNIELISYADLVGES